MLPSLLLGRAPKPRSNLVLSAITVQKNLQQLAQAGSLSYKKLKQLPIPLSFEAITLKTLAQFYIEVLLGFIFSKCFIIVINLHMGTKE